MKIFLVKLILLLLLFVFNTLGNLTNTIQNLYAQEVNQGAWEEYKQKREKIAELLDIPKSIESKINWSWLKKDVSVVDIEGSLNFFRYTVENLNVPKKVSMYPFHYSANFSTEEGSQYIKRMGYLLTSNYKSKYEDLNKRGLIVFYCGSGTDLSLVLDPKNYHNAAPLLLCYLLHYNVVVIPYIDSSYKCSLKNINEIANIYISCYSAIDCSFEILKKFDIPYDENAIYSTGVSYGGYCALVHAAFDDWIKKVFSVSGIHDFNTYLDPTGGIIYGGVNAVIPLIENDINPNDIYGLINADISFCYAMYDGYFGPTKFLIMQNAKKYRELRGIKNTKFLGLTSVKSHEWPVIEGLSYFSGLE